MRSARPRRAVRTDRRNIPAEQFFRGMYETALDEGEIVTAIQFPIPKRAGYVKFEQQASRFAPVGVFAAHPQHLEDCRGFETDVASADDQGTRAWPAFSCHRIHVGQGADDERARDIAADRCRQAPRR